MDDSPAGLLISVRPYWAAKLLSGEKTVELRRTRPRTWTGMPVWVYSSSPQRSLVGVSWLRDLEEGDVSEVWRRVAGGSAATFDEYSAYFAGASRAFGLRLDPVVQLGNAVGLRDLRAAVPGFRPPQSWRYVGAVEATRLNRLAGDLRLAS